MVFSGIKETDLKEECTKTAPNILEHNAEEEFQNHLEQSNLYESYLKVHSQYYSNISQVALLKKIISHIN